MGSNFFLHKELYAIGIYYSKLVCAKHSAVCNSAWNHCETGSKAEIIRLAILSTEHTMGHVQIQLEHAIIHSWHTLVPILYLWVLLSRFAGPVSHLTNHPADVTCHKARVRSSGTEHMCHSHKAIRYGRKSTVSHINIPITIYEL